MWVVVRGRRPLSVVPGLRQVVRAEAPTQSFTLGDLSAEELRLVADVLGEGEVSGVVAECGDGVEGFRVGDRVCMEWFSHCGTCRFCRVGKYNLCDSLARTSGKSHAGFAD